MRTEDRQGKRARQQPRHDGDPLTALLDALIEKTTDARGLRWLRRMRETPERASSAEVARRQAQQRKAAR